MATIQDVAGQAGVSVATVSRVLNASPRVSPEARARVLEAIERLDYRPNLLGRNLRRTETRMVLVLLPTIANPFYARIVHGIEETAQHAGYNVLLCNTGSDKDRERLYLGMLSQRLADAAILMAPVLGVDEMESLCRSHPLVQCCEYLEGAAVSHVTIDNRAAARDAVRHLALLGRRRIGMLSCRNRFVSTRDRLDGYKDALLEAGIPYDESLVAYGDYGFASGRRAAATLFGRPAGERPTAVFAICDLMAIGALRAAHETGLSVPGDVAVAGFDNIIYSSMTEPQITTVAQPQVELGRTAMEILLRQLRGESVAPENIVIAHELLVRGSTKR
jgi:LacI family transcriptional regulator, repressor for deo operon, udp, cdd, tsx, nupC, and nupG